ncbi:hypothetical protein N8T08_007673 [Aspergillus melleus]|uniref:Uncharacterized protein n=1 Tax=Aspergillus melleus TaxID=138277 RepID=A0ACC3BE27_9EURO|nr:hypothetical protein N8T08_007673 [Aspergillus melleus]
MTNSFFQALSMGLSLLAAVTAVEGLVRPADKGRLPALGWNSWNAFACDINATKVLTAARQVVDLGLKDLGYEYINSITLLAPFFFMLNLASLVDDCWSIKDQRDPVTKRMIPDPVKFPGGIAGVAKEIHHLGLKVGIYSNLKYDNCGVPSNWTDPYTHCVPDLTNGNNFPNGTCPDLTTPAPSEYDWRQSNTALRYRRMRDALLAVNRTIAYSLCVWGQADVGVWGNETGNSWRISGDITPTWTHIADLANQNTFLLNDANFWGFPDPDMLEVGNGNLTLAENRAHFALWAVMKAPLIIGTPLDKIPPTHLTILKNKYLIDFNQDPLIGRPAYPFKWGYNADWTFDPVHPAEYWAGESSTLGGTLVIMLNSEEQVRLRGFRFAEVPELQSKIRDGGKGKEGDGEVGFEVVDIWSGENLGCVKGGISREVGAHDVGGFVVMGRC